MNAAFQKILFQFTGRSELSAVSRDELRQITEAHPYFSPGHLLLSAKLKQENDPAFQSQVQRTAIAVNNNLWMDYLLNTAVTGAGEVKGEEPAISLPVNENGELPAPDPIQPLAEPDLAEALMVAPPEEEQYAANTTEEVMQQAADEEKQQEVIASVLEDQLAEFRKPVAPDAELPIATEPYHTVDYFASQGIKVDLTQPQDKLGSQLRKFTDWLKQMKNVKTEAADLGTDPEVENMIQGIAKTSNETREIVTETMADVLVKQGKTDKAIQLYIKLSFLNPDKSAYFAAKIEQLKGI